MIVAYLFSPTLNIASNNFNHFQYLSLGSMWLYEKALVHPGALVPSTMITNYYY